MLRRILGGLAVLVLASCAPKQEVDQALDLSRAQWYGFGPSGLVSQGFPSAGAEALEPSLAPRVQGFHRLGKTLVLPVNRWGLLSLKTQGPGITGTWIPTPAPWQDLTLIGTAEDSGGLFLGFRPTRPDLPPVGLMRYQADLQRLAAVPIPSLVQSPKSRIQTLWPHPEGLIFDLSPDSRRILYRPSTGTETPWTGPLPSRAAPVLEDLLGPLKVQVLSPGKAQLTHSEIPAPRPFLLPSLPPGGSWTAVLLMESSVVLAYEVRSPRGLTGAGLVNLSFALTGLPEAPIR